MLSSSYVHIRSCCSCTSTNVMEHDLTLCVSSSFFIQGMSNAAFGELRGSASTIMEVVILKCANSIRWILSSMGWRLLATLLDWIPTCVHSLLSSTTSSSCSRLPFGARCLSCLLLMGCYCNWATKGLLLLIVLTLHALVEAHASFAHHLILLLLLLIVLVLHLAELPSDSVIGPISTGVGRESLDSTEATVERGWCLLGTWCAD